LIGHADLLLVAGDLTQVGRVEEAKALASDLEASPVPVVVVFGNHDFQSSQQDAVRTELEKSGAVVLEREVKMFEFGNATLGVVGLKGFGGGFVGACATDFGEPEMKAFVGRTKSDAHFIRESLGSLKTDYRIALMHYSPVAETLVGEKKEIYPFLGSYLLAEAVDAAGADLVFHGHAHHGVEKGSTPGGIPVRNVAQSVIRHAFNIYTLNKEEGLIETYL
jgi:Icc-related predicted phosphoesterase